jgi:hypothetical protein
LAERNLRLISDVLRSITHELTNLVNNLFLGLVRFILISRLALFHFSMSIGKSVDQDDGKTTTNLGSHYRAPISFITHGVVEYFILIQITATNLDKSLLCFFCNEDIGLHRSLKHDCEY